jgi:hypothetical protein
MPAPKRRRESFFDFIDASKINFVAGRCSHCGGD